MEGRETLSRPYNDFNTNDYNAELTEELTTSTVL
jgi:hypothetical protein